MAFLPEPPLITIFPVTLTVPVDIVISESLLLFVVSAIEIEAQVNVPDPTARILLLLLPVHAFIVIAPETVKDLVELMVIVFEFPPEFITKVLQTAAVLTVTLKLLGITTSCKVVGTAFRDQLAAVFQLLLSEPSHVLVVCPHELLALSRKSSKNTAEQHDRCRREKDRKI